MKTKQSGIYAIKNTKNGKFYIGSSANISRRWGRHRSNLSRGVHVNDYLRNARNKHGEEAFEFEIIVECDEDDLIWIEQVYLDRYWDDGVLYNMNPLADRPPMTEETKEKMSKAAMGHTRNLGRKRTEETRARMSKAMVGNTNPSTKLTNQDVREIRRLYATGKVTQALLGKIWGIHQMTISRIVRKESWVRI